MEVPSSPTGQNLKAPVTLALITCMLLATLTALTFPKVEKLFSASNPQPYMWKFVTAAFSHGWAFLPPLTHLVANLALFFFVGPWTERLLGGARYFLLMLAAIFAAGLVRLIPGFGPSGSSAFILACGPVLMFRWMAIRNSEVFPIYHKLWLGLLVLGLMLVAPLVYGAWLAHQSSTPMLAFLQANAVHVTAFLAGGLATALWRSRLYSGFELEPSPPGILDQAAVYAAALLPTVMTVLIILGALKMI